MCQPVTITSRPICDIQHWQNVYAETERALPTVASRQATGTTVLYQQQQLHCLQVHIITQLYILTFIYFDRQDISVSNLLMFGYKKHTCEFES